MNETFRRSPCPGCGSALAFDPSSGTLACRSCGRTEPIPPPGTPVREHSYDAYLARRGEETPVARPEAACPSCGAAVAFPPEQTAGPCPFCAGSLVLDPRPAPPWSAPESVLPFRLAADQATAAVRRWLSSRWFAPNALKAVARTEALQGIYLPYWSYDARTETAYTGMRGDHYWESETTRDAQGRRQTRPVRRTRWRPAAGTVERTFDDVVVPAATTLPHAWLSDLEPWDLGELRPYDPAFLAGFRAQRAQVPAGNGLDEAKAAMSAVIARDVRAAIGGDEQQVHSLETAWSALTYKGFLLPVWLAAYRFRNRAWQVLVNARTGEVQGDRPYSPWKIAAAVLLALLAIGALVLVQGR